MKRMFRVAMVAACPFPCPRGTPIRILRCAEALARRGHEVHVVAYHLGSRLDGAPFALHRIPDVAGYRQLGPGPNFQKLLRLDPMLALRVMDLVRTRTIDVIHAHHYEGLLASLPASRRYRVPVVYDAHTVLETELPSYGMIPFAGFATAVGRWLDRQLPPRADHVIAVSRAIKTALSEEGAVSPDRITVAPSGVETDRFTLRTPRRTGSASQTVVFAGNLGPYQGIGDLLSCFRIIRDYRPDVRLRIVTDSSFQPYERLADELGLRNHIDLVDAPFEELPRQLATADIAMNPRLRADGIPQKLLNYMAAGKAIVSFAGSGHILEHGRTGWLVDGGSVSDLAAGALRLMSEPRLAAALGAAARDVVATQYTWDRTAATIEEVYADVTGDR